MHVCVPPSFFNSNNTVLATAQENLGTQHQSCSIIKVFQTYADIERLRDKVPCLLKLQCSMPYADSEKVFSKALWD